MVGFQILISTKFLFLQAGMLASDGRCKSLDAAADGYTRSEACAALLLSAAEGAARKDEFAILLAGTATNQDGRASSLTAPNGPSQV